MTLWMDKPDVTWFHFVRGLDFGREKLYSTDWVSMLPWYCFVIVVKFFIFEYKSWDHKHLGFEISFKCNFSCLKVCKNLLMWPNPFRKMTILHSLPTFITSSLLKIRSNIYNFLFSLWFFITRFYLVFLSCQNINSFYNFLNDVS